MSERSDGLDTPRIASEVFEQIYRHASVRRYRPEPLPRATVEAVVAAGQRSSTSSNLQMFSVVAVTDPARRALLAELCGNQAHIAQAPVFLAWCADLSRLERASELRGYTQVSQYVENFLLAAVDAAIAMQTATLAAESLGLGMCYIGAIRNQPLDVIELLELPKLVFPISGMTLGWPDGEHRPRPRLPLEAVLHWERYDASDEEALVKSYDRAMAETGIYAGRQVAVPGKEGEMEDYGWSEHSARRVSEPKRVHLRAALAQQGFTLK